MVIIVSELKPITNRDRISYFFTCSHHPCPKVVSLRHPVGRLALQMNVLDVKRTQSAINVNDVYLLHSRIGLLLLCVTNALPCRLLTLNRHLPYA